MKVRDERKLMIQCVVFLIAIAAVFFILTNLLFGDQFVYHSQDGKHYLVKSESPIEVMELPVLSFTGTPPVEPVPPLPTPPTSGLVAKVDAWADAVPNYTQKLGDRASLAAIYQIASEQSFSTPVQVATWMTEEFRKAEEKNLLSSEWSTRWKTNFRDPLGIEINNRIQAGQLSTPLQISEFNNQVYIGLSQVEVNRNPFTILDVELKRSTSALTPDTILQVIQIIRDGIQNEEPFFSILIKVIILLLSP